MQTAKNASQSVVKNRDVKMTMRKRIGSTTYRIGIYFNPDAKETLNEKVARLLKNDLQSMPGSATMELLQAGWLSERNVV